MNDIQDIHGEFVGCDQLHIAKVIEDSAGNFTVEAPRYFAPLADAASQSKETKKSSSYDNKIHRTYVVEGPSEVNLNVSNIPADIWAETNGKGFNENDGRVYDSGEPKKEYYALGLRYNIGDNHFRYQWFLKGIFSAGKEEAKSKGESVDIKTYQCVYTAIPTSHAFEYQANGVTKNTPLKRIFGDTTKAAFDPAGWFDQVQTPDTSGAPDAIELSSIVPADGAANVAVDSSIVATFSNPIKSDNINLVDTDSGSIVAVTKSWNDTRTVLTMTPISDLSNDTSYNVALFGIVDDYSQELAPSIQDFTTVAA